MGTTGSGKITFIESLSPSRPLKISGNTLESVTQTLQPCLLTGVCPHPDKSNPAHSIVLIDTPGMADDKISEYRVVGEIVTWLKERLTFYYIKNSTELIL
ncbi:hypothetical protein BJ165DRAFT_373541 [Panaeolus papilionaceus]|nr:hypothetical protein BJ165DRAFT_373541 [Panaeolus papilionaceus]